MSCNCGNPTCGGGCSSSCGCSCGNPTCGGCCNQTVVQPYTVNPCTPSSTNCGTNLPTPAPYYQCAPQCQENHCQEIQTFLYATAICVNFAWNVPECGQTATLYFSDVRVLPVGAYIWHADFGYFEILSFDSRTGQVVVLNPCLDGNAAPGTNIPACTCFVVTDPPAEIPDPDNPCVAIDFTAPAIDVPLDITVTSTDGLEVGSLVAIGSGIYFLQAIVSPTIITIVNQGQGITPGTPVIARDAAGNLQYCLVSTAINACTKDVVESGVVLACNENETVPLGGATVGHVLTLQNAGTDVAAFAAPCCDAILDEFGGSLTPCSDFENLTNYFNDTSDVTQEEILGPGEVFTSDIATVSFTNTSECRNLIYFHNSQARLRITALSPGNLGRVDYDIELQVQYNGGGYNTVRTENYVQDITSGNWEIHALSWELNHFGVAQVAPAGVTTIDVRAVITNDPTTGGSIGVFDFVTEVTGIFVAV